MEFQGSIVCTVMEYIEDMKRNVAVMDIILVNKVNEKCPKESRFNQRTEVKDI